MRLKAASSKAEEQAIYDALAIMENDGAIPLPPDLIEAKESGDLSRLKLGNTIVIYLNLSIYIFITLSIYLYSLTDSSSCYQFL